MFISSVLASLWSSLVPGCAEITCPERLEQNHHYGDGTSLQASQWQNISSQLLQEQCPEVCWGSGWFCKGSSANFRCYVLLCMFFLSSPKLAEQGCMSADFCVISKHPCLLRLCFCQQGVDWMMTEIGKQRHYENLVMDRFWQIHYPWYHMVPLPELHRHRPSTLGKPRNLMEISQKIRDLEASGHSAKKNSAGRDPVTCPMCPAGSHL